MHKNKYFKQEIESLPAPGSQDSSGSEGPVFDTSIKQFPIIGSN